MTFKLLTHDEWLAATITPPFNHIEVTHPNWEKVHREMIVKWIETHCGAGWVYWDGKKQYVFGNSGDYVLFKMWISDNPFENDGEIE